MTVLGIIALGISLFVFILFIICWIFIKAAYDLGYKHGNEDASKLDEIIKNAIEK